MNKSDSERIASLLEKLSYKKAQQMKEANLIVVNMCSVRQSAVDRVFGLEKKFKELKKTNKKLKTILTGCISLKDLRKFKKFFDYILPIKALKDWPKFLKKGKSFFFPQRESFFVKKFNLDYLKIPPKFSKNFSVFIPISSGCNNFCTFCIVPFTRGPLICRDHKDILKEVKKALKKGAKEIWLLGQNVNDYLSPSNSSINFAKLLKMINEIKGNFWIRFTSPHPKNFSKELIETIAKCEKITPYLNLPLQSGDNEILKRMNRKYTVKEYKNLVKKIRSAFRKFRKGTEKEVSISTDIIVGFPGETKKQFQNTIKLVKEIKFDSAYIACFSPRPQTFAEKLKDNISLKEKREREKILSKEIEKLALEKNKKFIGKVVEVLIEKEKKGFIFGKSRHFKTVKIRGRDLIGEFKKVKIKKATPFGLEGELIK